MTRKFLFTAGLFALILAASPAMAHFQMVYTPETALARPGSIDLKLVFTHPFEAGHTMDMERPQEFFLVRKNRKRNLLDALEQIKWKSLTNSGDAYEADIRLRGMGDSVFCLVPSPYYEKKEGCYIQQITKMVVNTAGFPTDWDREIGLPAEIVPLDKPYALWTGNVFRGVVKSAGSPVPYAEIEVEYLNHRPLMQENGFAQEASVKAPQDSFVTMSIKADSDGEFAFGIPRAGWWGFCALGAGPEKTFKGKELSQDAVIWVQARDMN